MGPQPACDGSSLGHNGKPSTRMQPGTPPDRREKLRQLATQRNQKLQPKASLPDEEALGLLPSLSLAAVLPSAQWDGGKLAVVEKGISHFGVLPKQYLMATTLYISHNNLSSLHGLQQLPHLRVLSAGVNLLGSLEAQQPLRSCPIEVLSLEGNPVCELPNYRAHVVVMVPTMATLDGVVVMPEERLRASEAVQQEAACLLIMVSNACLVHKLVSC